MVAPEAFGNQHFNGVAQHLITLVAEHTFSLGIHHFDNALAVDHHHGVRRRLDDLAKALFALLENFLDGYSVL